MVFMDQYVPVMCKELKISLSLILSDKERSLWAFGQTKITSYVDEFVNYTNALLSATVF